MKAKQLLFSLFALLMAMAARADVRVNATNFPDANFRNWVLAQSYGSDRVLTDEEIASITDMDISAKNIRSLKGIEFFTALIELYCSDNQLTALDVSGCTALAELDCSNNQLMTLNVSGCSTLIWLNCYQNQIMDADMDALVEALPDIVDGIMNVIYNENEQNVMTYAQVAAARAKGWTPMYLDMDWNWHEYDGSEPVITINAKNFPDENFRNWVLNQTYGRDGVITNAEITNVNNINVYNTSIQDLKGIEYFTSLKELDCRNNQLIALDVSKNIALTKLNCYSNKLATLDVSKNTELTYLDCSYNQLTELEMSGPKALTELCCYHNLLTTLDVSGCVALTKLDCFENRIRGEGMDALLESLPSITGGKLYVVQSGMEFNVMNTIQAAAANDKGWIPHYYSIEYPYGWVEFAGTKDLNVTDAEINETNFPDTRFRTWALSQPFGSDGWLSISEALIINSIDVSDKGIKRLKGIECFAALTFLDCSINEIKGSAMDEFVECLPTVKEGALNAIYYEKEGNVMTIDQVNMAKAKGWIARKFFNSDVFGWQKYDGSDPSIIAVKINETNFPDANFRDYLLGLEQGNDGMLTEADIASISLIWVSYENIWSLKGIEYFKMLETLRCSGNQLTSLDVSKNTVLTRLWCDDNQLTALDVSNNTALTVLWCYNNQLTALDVSKNTALTELYCYSNNIWGAEMDTLVESLPTINSGIMRVIYKENEMNVMTTLQVATAKAKGWTPQYNRNYDWYEYTGCEPASGTIIDSTNFPDSNFRNYLRSQEYGKDAVLTEAEIANVKSIDVNSKNIWNLKGIEFFTTLTTLDCSKNQLTELDLSNITMLSSLNCGSNQLTALDVSQNTTLKSLSCNDNQLTTLDVTKNIMLTSLSCGNNQLTTLDVSENTALTGLACDQNQLTSLDVSKNTELRTLYCFNNRIRGAEMDNLIAGLPTVNNGYLSVNIYAIGLSDELNVMNTEQVAATEAKGWTPWKLEKSQSGTLSWIIYRGSEPVNGKEIDAFYFPDENFCNWLRSQDYGTDGVLADEEIDNITEMDVSNKNIRSLTGIEHFIALKVLKCSDNYLTDIDVTKNTALKTLFCSNNKLTELDASKNTTLEWLNCSQNLLTKLIVSDNSPLEILECYQNRINGKAMDELVRSLPNRNYDGVWSVITNSNEQNLITIEQVAAAKAKHWVPYAFDGKNLSEYAGFNPENSIAIIAANFPDENFRNWVLSQEYGADGVLTDEEIATVTYINVRSRNIQNLKGIEFFTALTELNCCQNQIKDDDMDALVDGLPVVSFGQMYVIYGEDEQNVMTIDQVDAAKAKGWITKYYNGIRWLDYEGDPDGIKDIDHSPLTTDHYYNLAGQRLQKMQKGINIVNGKKVLVK